MEQGLRTEGNVTFVEVLVARKTAFDAQWEYVSAQTELAKAGAVLDGLILSGGLDETRDTEMDSGLRDQSLSGQ
jgi:cobalt-zinc-cadmium efflux system outer membrane protein